jgi:hypothetical protein
MQRRSFIKALSGIALYPAVGCATPQPPFRRQSRSRNPRSPAFSTTRAVAMYGRDGELTHVPCAENEAVAICWIAVDGGRGVS